MSIYFIKTSSAEPLNPKAESFVPPALHAHVRQQSSSTSLHYCHSPTSPPRRGLSASMHAPSPPARGSNVSMHAPSLPRKGLSASIHAPSPLPRSIYSNTSIHAPTEAEDGDEDELSPKSIPVIDLSPDRRVRRQIDPTRDVDVVVLVGGDSVSP